MKNASDWVVVRSEYLTLCLNKSEISDSFYLASIFASKMESCLSYYDKEDKIAFISDIIGFKEIALKSTSELKLIKTTNMAAEIKLDVEKIIKRRNLMVDEITDRIFSRDTAKLLPNIDHVQIAKADFYSITCNDLLNKVGTISFYLDTESEVLFGKRVNEIHSNGSVFNMYGPSGEGKTYILLLFLSRLQLSKGSFYFNFEKNAPVLIKDEAMNLASFKHIEEEVEFLKEYYEEFHHSNEATAVEVICELVEGLIAKDLFKTKLFVLDQVKDSVYTNPRMNDLKTYFQKYKGNHLILSSSINNKTLKCLYLKHLRDKDFKFEYYFFKRGLSDADIKELYVDLIGSPTFAGLTNKLIENFSYSLYHFDKFNHIMRNNSSDFQKIAEMECLLAEEENKIITKLNNYFCRSQCKIELSELVYEYLDTSERIDLSSHLIDEVNLKFMTINTLSNTQKCEIKSKYPCIRKTVPSSDNKQHTQASQSS